MDITFDYYKKRNGEDYVIPKQIINESIDPYDPTTYLRHLEAMDYPYIINEWQWTRDYCIKNKTPKIIFPKYIAKMHLRAYKNFTWKDSEMINKVFDDAKNIYTELEKLKKERVKKTMTTKEFLNRFDNKDHFTEQELENLWWGDLLDEHAPEVAPEEYSDPDRWNTMVSKVIQIEDRYFMVYKYQGNTEYQETYYDVQPDEVYPVEKTIICWEGVPPHVLEEEKN